jgi:hypothetical protein
MDLAEALPGEGSPELNKALAVELDGVEPLVHIRPTDELFHGPLKRGVFLSSGQYLPRPSGFSARFTLAISRAAVREIDFPSRA